MNFKKRGRHLRVRASVWEEERGRSPLFVLPCHLSDVGNFSLSGPKLRGRSRNRLDS